MNLKSINPESLGAPKGYSNGIVVPPGASLVFISGQIGSDVSQNLVSNNFVDQFDQALANVIAVAESAGSGANKIARLTIYVTDTAEYKAHTQEIGEKYRNRMGRHFPAMALVEVKRLLEEGANVEIEGVAVF